MMTQCISLVFGLTVVFVCVAICYSDCPQNTFTNESATSVTVCSTVKCLKGLMVSGCIGPDNVLDNPRGIDVWTKSIVWRRGAIHDLPHLEDITAWPTGVSRLNPGVFLNLPKLKTVTMNYGELEEIPWGVFSNSTIEEITLKFNMISYVEDQAFSNMPNLKMLFMNHNKLKEINQNWFVNSYGLRVLVLSYNEINKIHPFTFSVFPDLNYLDLSFNQIIEFGGRSLENVKSLSFLDLTSNNLSWIPTSLFTTQTEVEEFRLPLNHLSFLSTDVLDNGNVKSLSLHPNPWQCACLNDVLKWMHDHNATLNSPGDDYRIIYDSSRAECAFNSKSPDKCVMWYDDEFLIAQEIFFKEINYTDVVRAKPTSERPDFNTIATAKPFPADLSPLY